MEIVDGKWREPLYRGVELKGSTLYVSLSSSVLREELSYGKDKIIAMLNEELRKEVVKTLVLR